MSPHQVSGPFDAPHLSKQLYCCAANRTCTLENCDNTKLATAPRQLANLLGLYGVGMTMSAPSHDEHSTDLLGGLIAGWYNSFIIVIVPATHNRLSQNLTEVVHLTPDLVVGWEQVAVWPCLHFNVAHLHFTHHVGAKGEEPNCTHQRRLSGHMGANDKQVTTQTSAVSQTTGCKQERESITSTSSTGVADCSGADCCSCQSWPQAYLSDQTKYDTQLYRPFRLLRCRYGSPHT